MLDYNVLCCRSPKAVQRLPEAAPPLPFIPPPTHLRSLLPVLQVIECAEDTYILDAAEEAGEWLAARGGTPCLVVVRAA